MRSITVLGGGESGVGAALLAKSKDINVFVSDYGKISDPYRKELQENNIPFEEGGHSFEKIEKTELIVISPGIPEKAAVVQHFRLRNKRIISEIEFAFIFYSGKIVAITGSNGKTTTASLTYQILKESNLRVGLGGNIGYSFARLLANNLEYDWVVLELSSFQLEGLRDFQADISALINITPDHLDRYDYDFNKYAKAKWILPLHTKSEGLVILNHDDKTTQDFAIEYPVDANIVWLSANDPDVLVSTETNKRFEINLFGSHNYFNAAVAKNIAEKIGLSFEQIQTGLSSFNSIEHRLETVIKFNGVLVVNDSKATNLDASEVALKAFDKPIIWIAGGTDKGNDYQVIKDIVASKVKSLICLCVDGKKLVDAFEGSVENLFSTQSMKEAIDFAMNVSERGDIILLSPACASFDLFNNYEHRGKEFKKAVFEYIDEIGK